MRPGPCAVKVFDARTVDGRHWSCGEARIGADASEVLSPEGARVGMSFVRVSVLSLSSERS